VERYKNENYPQLKSNIYAYDNQKYNHHDNNSLKLSQKEYALKNRTKAPTLKEQFKTKLETLLDSATSYKDLLEQLASKNIEIVKR
jgi:hypothetical protein